MNPTCTELLRVHPCDPDGPLRESLSSLLIRTAAKNDVTPARLLAQKFTHGMGASWSARAIGPAVGQSLNGSGDLAARFVARTEELTQLSNLRACTTISFAPFATKNGLLRSHLAWSPELLLSAPALYHPLLFALDPVRVCPASRRPLVSCCYACKEPMPNLSGSARSGYCPKCGAPLADPTKNICAADVVANAVADLDYEAWIAQQLGEFIQFQTRKQLAEDFDYTDTLKHWLKKFEISPDSAGARMLGIPPASLCIWLSTGAKPMLRVTLRMCWVLGISLLDFLHRRLPANHDGKLQEPIERRARCNKVFSRKKIDKAELGAKLSTILRENQYALLPFDEICRKKLERGAYVVRQYFPDEAKEISKRYLRNRKLLAEIQQEQFCTAIRTVAKFLHSIGVVPNHKTMKQYLDRPTRLRCSWAIEALQRIREELGYYDDGEQLDLLV